MQEVNDLWEHVLKQEIRKDIASNNKLDIKEYRAALVMKIVNECSKLASCDHSDCVIQTKSVLNPVTDKFRVMKIRTCNRCGRVHYKDNNDEWV